MGAHCCESKSTELVKLREKQAGVLKIVLAINLVMFGLEFVMGLRAESTALMGDSLDMLGDAIVYGFSLYVLHKSERVRATAALMKGLLVMAFGLWVFGEAVLKILTETLPEALTIGVIGFIALVANLICLLLLTRHKDDDLNMKSTWICSRNDIISNMGVLAAASLVAITGSKWPDIGIGLIISILFLKSAWPILFESLAAMKKHDPRSNSS